MVRFPGLLLTALLALLTLVACGGEPDTAPPADDIPPAEPPDYDAARFAGIDDDTWRAYLRLQDALAHDRFADAHAAAQDLAAAGGELAPLAEAAARTDDITGLRIAFAPVSEAMIARADRPAGYAVAYCPMAFDYEGGRWVQAEEHLMNPYFGDRMLRCGAFEDDASADGAAP